MSILGEVRVRVLSIRVLGGDLDHLRVLLQPRCYAYRSPFLERRSDKNGEDRQRRLDEKD